MKIKIKTWLYDIHRSINEIEIFIREITQFDDFSRDIKTIKSVERILEIIGEASNRILKEDKNIAEKISQIRNIMDTQQ